MEVYEKFFGHFVVYVIPTSVDQFHLLGLQFLKQNVRDHIMTYKCIINAP